MENNTEKIISLYKYLKELAAQKTKTVTDIKKQIWSKLLDEISQNSQNVVIFDRNDVENEEPMQEDNILLKVKKGEYEECPQPNIIFQKWLESGWDDFHLEVGVKESVENQVFLSKDNVQAEKFEDNDERVKEFSEWKYERNEWSCRQKGIERDIELFTKLYEIHTDLERDSETNELMIGNGFIKIKADSAIHHPILLRRIKVEFDSYNNEIMLKDIDAKSELYTALLGEITNINHDAVNTAMKELEENDYHPFAESEIIDFLKSFVYNLSSDSEFVEDTGAVGIPKAGIVLYLCPVIFLRKKLDGTLKAIEQIVENIEDTDYVPKHLLDIVNGGKVDIPVRECDITIEEQLAEVGGEDRNIFLSKEANKEQLEIAQRIEMYNAVLVQGPPGTGKTHTIANLMGHFLAQGKSVLVTSHTSKALSVLKEKVPERLQNLCVSLLNDSNADMEKSVEGITDFMGANTANELRREMESAERRRIDVMNKLAETRKRIYQIKCKECNNIVFDGEEISPSQAAKYVYDNREKLSYIPGKVRLNCPFPVSYDEIDTLYQSNAKVTEKEEEELQYNLPDYKKILQPDDFKLLIRSIDEKKSLIVEIEKKKGWRTAITPEIESLEVTISECHFQIPLRECACFEAFGEYVDSFEEYEDWMRYAIVDGAKGGTYTKRWDILIDQIQKTKELAESLVTEQFGKVIEYGESSDLHTLTGMLVKLKDVFLRKGKILKIDLFLHKEYSQALKLIKINNLPITNAEECDMVLHKIQLTDMREKCSMYWNELIGSKGAVQFEDLDSDEPEYVAAKWIGSMQRMLQWKNNEYAELKKHFAECKIPEECVMQEKETDSEMELVEKIMKSIKETIPTLLIICKYACEIIEDEKIIRDLKNVLQKEKRLQSDVCRNLVEAIQEQDEERYKEEFIRLSEFYEKYALQNKRETILEKISSVAPQWADAIRRREGIHGECAAPSTIEDAWRWKQYEGIISDIMKESFEELQKDSIRLSSEYRKATAELAEKSAWYHLLLRTETDLDMKQALQGWKQTVKKIGKGTGKRAPKMRAEARKLMAKCQKAVPAWIMPVSKVLENLNLKKNRFDIVIIDEASQSDITALAIFYLAKKVIVVGDDKQVSPMAVGMDNDKMDALVDMYIRDVIPNYHLFNAKTSLYDIAGTTFQPLMLREHFRCVPEIIGFSNKLSYSYKIKPLRDASESTLLPAVINYRVEDGERNFNSKTNEREAERIVSLMMACMEQQEYKRKTFGVISMLGDQQAKMIQSLMFQKIGTIEMEKYRILCGNASNFQGDERDVIFLSMIDSGTGNGPLSMMGYGVEDAYKKRYNVATSRAKDQLWVVHSLDAANDLKQGDLRKELLDYAANPNAYQKIVEEIIENSESPFEEEVAKALAARGYHLVQQWKVGAYRLDMVAICGNKKIAIECDGERFHSGEEKIREDMERQTILERIGWRFIRIRGSEYFHNPDVAIEYLVSRLKENGIEPEGIVCSATVERSTELLQRVKRRALEIEEEWNHDTIVTQYPEILG